MADLERLAQHREALLLAEVAAWLHDDFKHTDAHIHKYVTGAPRPSGRQNTDDLIPYRIITLLGRSLPLSDIRKRKKPDFISGYLNRCHYTAHIEKQDGDGRQTYPVYLSSPFGCETDSTRIPSKLAYDLRLRISWSDLGASPFTKGERDNLLGEIKTLFERVGGDTRRPANEITLWEWGHTVGALYKAALAGALLGFSPQADNLRWRLLSVRFDTLPYLLQVHRLPDLQARQRLLTEALDKVRELLEVTYPLGTEVYRDENGSVFVVPGCDKTSCALDILALQDGGESLKEHILGQVRRALEDEVVPVIRIDPTPWWGQDPQRQGNDELPPVPQHTRPVVTSSDPQWVELQWKSEEPSQVCTVCGLRPQGPSPKAKERNVCDVCEQRRADRAKAWATQNLDTTIWLDEVADENGRLALIVGRFDLEHWLDGSLVRTLAVREPNDQNGHTADQVAKNPSFARLRRVWETTRTFWQEVAPTDEDTALTTSLVARSVKPVGPRLEIRGKLSPKRSGDTLGRYHTYELVLPPGFKLSVVWDEDEQRFITCDNLVYAAKLLKGDLPKRREGETEDEHLQRLHKWGVDQVKSALTGTLTVEEPVGYGARNKVWGTITLTRGAEEVPNSTYTPAIPILAEPRTFMALVPADKALELVQAIKTKYEREMGKVRNRLPLHLGVVYAHRRTPLRAVLDAGRRMLKVGESANRRIGEWEVVRPVTPQTGTLPKKELADGTHQFDRWYAVQLKHRTQKSTLTWYVPAVMGDGNTEDWWYPYVFLADAAEPRSRTRYFRAENPWNPQHPWLVHVEKLQVGDVVYFTPATFDYQWLDSSARRFEIAYEEDSRRRGNPFRPYLLDEVDDLVNCWSTLSRGLHLTQIHALREDIEAKRAAWFVAPEDSLTDEAFQEFCRWRLANAQWKEGRPPDQMETLTDWAVRGLLTDAVELYLHVMKTPRSEGEDR